MYFINCSGRQDCEKCEEYEDALFSIREDLVDSLNAWVVKSIQSQLVRIYSPSKEPAVVFFRHGVPLLYDGKPVELIWRDYNQFNRFESQESTWCITQWTWAGLMIWLSSVDLCWGRFNIFLKRNSTFYWSEIYWHSHNIILYYYYMNCDLTERLENSSKFHYYSPTGEPNDELMLHTFLENKEPCVRELNDDNFEHLTQAATGATTGDWFIFLWVGMNWLTIFSSPSISFLSYWQNYDSPDIVILLTVFSVRTCKRDGKPSARSWKLDLTLPESTDNSPEKSPVDDLVLRRFRPSYCKFFCTCELSTFFVMILPSPLTVIFRYSFRHGKMYRYNSVQYDVASLSTYPIEGYLKARIEDVPIPKSPV